MNRHQRLMAALAVFCALSAPTMSAAQQAPKRLGSTEAVKLYALDCGLTEFKDASYFSDTGEYDASRLRCPRPAI